MIFLGLGANLPTDEGRTPLQTLEAACVMIQELAIEILNLSSFWRSEPVPPSEQPWFINAVLEIETEMGPHELMAHLLAIEQALGRERREKWAARIIDIDLLAYGTLILDAVDHDGRKLMLPHPHLSERRFVLAPMAEIAPDWLHPSLQETTTGMLAALTDGGQVQKLET